MEHQDDLKHLDNSLKENSFSVPEGYFKKSGEGILSRARLTTLEQESFSVPEGYFETLPERILSQVKEQKRPVYIRYISYAAAAVVMLGLSFTFFWNGAGLSGNQYQELVHEVPESDIIGYLEYYTAPEDAQMVFDTLDEESTIRPAGLWTEEEMDAYLREAF